MDICIFTNVKDFDGYLEEYAVDNSVFPNDFYIDLSALLTHEIGHAIGSIDPDDDSKSHKEYAVMDGQRAAAGTTRGRYPFGHDVEGMRKLYGWYERHPGWKDWDWSTESWGATTYFFSSDVLMYPAADVGYSYVQDKWQVISSQMTAGSASDEGARLHFTRFDYPINAPEEANRYYDTTTWRPPGIGGGRRHQR